MLELVDIKKDYAVAGEAVHALKGISLKFRRNEFVSILGASGCGKTTLLNIIGGLDQYTSGDLIIEGVSTKTYKDKEWDTYRNHSIGFIFQSYHLIPHQTVLQNVELALTISGVSKDERRKRAVEALEKVGLGDKLHNKPNQLSGGQAQRVAIARALINDPEVVLADEPTGALDSVTSVQIMELLKEISKDRLVIMVTHNPELAEKYSTRIIRLLDGLVTGDSMPYDGEEAELPVKEEAEVDDGVQNGKKKKAKKKNSSMPLLMAFGLSLKNLLSKFRRTAMVSVAGSIGIIGVSLVLAISAGVQDYIQSMQDDMLSGNPVAITQSAIDYDALMNMSMTTSSNLDITKLKDKLYVQSLMDTLGQFSEGFSRTNKITSSYLDYINKIPDEQYNAIKFGYGYEVANNIYTDFSVDGTADDDASGTLSVTAIRGMYTQILLEQPKYKDFAGTISTVATFIEVPNNYDFIMSQYDVLAADMNGEIVYEPTKADEDALRALFADKQSLIMVVSENEVTDLVTGQFGYLTEKEFLNYAYDAVDDALFDESVGLVGKDGIDFDKFIGSGSKKFKWYSNDEVYQKVNGAYIYKPYKAGNKFKTTFTHPIYGEQEIELPLDDIQGEGLELGVKLILQKKQDISYGCLDSGFYYTNALSEYARANARESDIVKSINKSAEESGKDYIDTLPYSFKYKVFERNDGGEIVKSETKWGTGLVYDSGGILDMLMLGLSGSGENEMYRVKASLLGGAELPLSARIYPVDFESKNFITDYLTAWNTMCENGETYTYTENGAEKVITLSVADKITYSDTVGLIINMVNTMIQMITIALVAFTALSLVVSTVMIGIITYVSVVERIKEIGILRAVGARKKDIKRLFNAETFIIGLVAGAFGILITYVLSLIINVIVLSFAGIWGIVALPWWQAGIMIILSVCLTLVSGLIPASAAAKKDPVVALRTE